MKRIIAVSMLAIVAACTPAEEAGEATEEAVVEEVAEVPAADGGPAYGIFKVTLADGTSVTEDVRADGTWTSTNADGTQSTGTWVQKPGEYCTTEDKEGAVEKCYAEKIDENGVWVSTDPDDGSVATVERIVEEESAAE